MKNIVCSPKPFIAGLLLLLAACVKDPSPDTPIPPKPEWLLTKVVTLERKGEPEGGPITYSAIVDEYQYNRQHKPWLHIEYSGPDTNNLKIENADTVFYDKELRPVRRSSSALHIYRSEGRFYYKGDERLPDKTVSILIDSFGTVVSDVTTRYVYNDTIVYTFNELSHVDTTGYVYNRRGNCIGYYSSDSGVQLIYETYDNAVNVNRFLNTGDWGALGVREGEGGPVLSKNNWTRAVPTETLDRNITYDGQGRVSTSSIEYYYPTRKVTSYYYYTLIN